MNEHELRSALADVADDQTLAEVWSEVEQRRVGGRARTRGTLVGLATLAFSVGLVCTWWVLRPAPKLEPLRLTEAPVLGGELAVGPLKLDDASIITPAPGAQLAVLENSGARLQLALRSGRTRFEVTPNTGRTWRVLAGDVTVEVVGTVFTVERGALATRVDVERGVVLVEGERVPGRLVRLEAGQHLELPAARAANAPAHVPAVAVAPTAPEAQPSVAQLPAARAAVAPDDVPAPTTAPEDPPSARQQVTRPVADATPPVAVTSPVATPTSASSAVPGATPTSAFASSAAPVATRTGASSAVPGATPAAAVATPTSASSAVPGATPTSAFASSSAPVATPQHTRATPPLAPPVATAQGTLATSAAPVATQQGSRATPPIAVAQSASTLLEQADAERRAGQLERARATLAIVIDAHPGTAEAGLAAFTLGRLHEELGEQRQARLWFSRALAMGLPPPLQRVAELKVRDVP